ncbi:hypothetical protein J6590_028593 [Homalodisca vitripennis]|nr:hypothetical protein J6590_028593 [Homalodisca vitripennis]
MGITEWSNKTWYYSPGNSQKRITSVSPYIDVANFSQRDRVLDNDFVYVPQSSGYLRTTVPKREVTAQSTRKDGRLLILQPETYQ